MFKLKKALLSSACFTATGIFAIILARATDGFAEWYADHIFPAFHETIGRIMSLFPFSVMEILIYALACCFALYFVYFLFLAVVPRWRVSLKKASRRALCAVLLIASFSFMMYSLACAVNYERDTFASITERQMTQPTKEGLLELCELLIRDINEVSEEVSTDTWGVLTLRDVDIRKEARDAMTLLGKDVGALAGFYPNPKPVIASKLMSKLNFTGIYSPVTVEANYNNDIPDHIIPFTICHELAHIKGFVREDEAGFIAYLACRKSQSAEFRYSGAINALSYALNAYREVATPEEYSALYETIPLQAERDYWENRAYWRQHQGRAAEIAAKVNDTYLKANAQEDGVKSYGRMIDLLLAEYRITGEI
jgi:hypothetical protein